MLELLFEALGEFALQAAGEVLLELGLHSVAEPFRRPPRPWLAAPGYAIFGALFGALSLLLLSHHLTPEGPLRLLNLALTPLAVGGLMAAMGAWRARRGEPLLRINRFCYGFLFALCFALVRYAFAE
ncbi:MAG: hypothetical protein JO200_16910 [Comamonas sp.]|nr:hypothetical protein [Comamonas sp.]